MSHGGSGNRWLVSYADFITLLMVLFVILWSMGRTDIEKFKALAESLSVAFGGGGAASRVVDPSINQGSGKLQNGVPDPIQIAGIPQRPPQAVEIGSQLSDMLSSYGMEGSISVETNIEGKLISASEKLLFEPGTTRLQFDAYGVLDTIIRMLINMENDVRIVGHTDNSLPQGYASNWELSYARAWVIAEYMMQAGITPDRIIVSGRGEYEPVFPNDTDEHRALNSRADIVIMYATESDVVSGESPLAGP